VRVQLPRIPDFASADWQNGRSDAELTVSILEGKGTNMPSFRGKLGEDQAHDLVTHIRSIAPRVPPSGRVPRSDFYRRFLLWREKMEELKREYRAVAEAPVVPEAERTAAALLDRETSK
jgi:hypothetical protein